MSLADEEAERMLAALSEHFKEPVMPMSRYCDAMRVWARAVIDGDYGGKEMADAIYKVELAIEKSNLLFRLLYLGEKLRTKKCPVHDGHWIGCWGPERPCECKSGDNVTGWLPEEP